MFSRQLAMPIILLVGLTFICLFTIKRYYYEQPFNSLIVATCRNTNFSRDGAFYREEDKAKWDEDWEKKVCPLRKLNDLNDFYEYIFTKTVPCDIQLMLGGHLKNKIRNIDGDKWVCLDKKFNISPLNCLVFSFGIGDDWSFEDDVAAKLGCKVFAFDPTIKKETHNRTPQISFFNLGISDSNQTGPDVKIKKNRYGNILDGLGHLNSNIDILKMDVEKNELRFFRDVFENTPNLLKKVKMLAMEVHTSGSLTAITESHKAFWKYFQLLDCFGFKIWHSAVNPFTGGRVVNGRHRSCCYEIVWVQDRQW